MGFRYNPNHPSIPYELADLLLKQIPTLLCCTLLDDLISDDNVMNSFAYLPIDYYKQLQNKNCL